MRDTLAMLQRLESTDIREWLEHPRVVAAEAAAEITRLRERVAELEGALKFYSCDCQPGQCENGPLESNIDTVSCGHRARAALRKKG